MTTPRDPEYQIWLRAAANAEDGHYRAGISFGGLILLILLIAVLF